MFIADATCKKCGYNLCGSSAARCSECGHAFDPNDSSTYDTKASRRRRRNRGIATTVAIALFVSVACPYKALRLKAVWICSNCNETYNVYRWEPMPRDWIRFLLPRLPGATLMFRPSGNCKHSFNALKVWFESPIVPNGGASVNCSPSEDIIVSDEVANPSNSAWILYQLSAPQNDKIHVTCKDKPPVN